MNRVKKVECSSRKFGKIKGALQMLDKYSNCIDLIYVKLDTACLMTSGLFCISFNHVYFLVELINSD